MSEIELSRTIVDLNVAGSKARLQEIADELEFEIYQQLSPKAKAIINKIQKEE